MLPEATQLLEFYWGMTYSAPWLFLTVMFSILFVYVISYRAGQKDGLKYVWRVGIPHSQKCEDQLYLKWKNKIRD